MWRWCEGGSVGVVIWEWRCGGVGSSGPCNSGGGGVRVVVGVTMVAMVPVLVVVVP